MYALHLQILFCEGLFSVQNQHVFWSLVGSSFTNIFSGWNWTLKKLCIVI